jgi:signal transduction histidine kinase/CheY-like chemotaxis protein
MTPSVVTPIRAFSLRTHLLLLVIGTTLPALVVAAFLARRVVMANETTLERRLLEAANAEAAIVDSELMGTMRALQGLSASDRLSHNELPEFYAQAQRLLPLQPTWFAISLSSPDGRQILNTARPLGDALPFVTDVDSFKRTVIAKSQTVGNLRKGNVTDTLGFPVRVPVIRDGRVTYVLSAWITSRKFADVLRRGPSLSDEWVRGVVDAAGVLVVRSRDSERFVGQRGTPGFLERSSEVNEGVYRDVALDGTRVYGAFSRGPVSNWLAGVAVPASVLDAPLRQSSIAIGLITLLLLGLGGGGTYLISRRVSSGIGKSIAEAEAIAGGHHSSQRGSRVTEIQRLLDALAQSAALLDTRQRERDEHVARADEARAEAEAANRAKDQFLAMLGHELRNPLAPALTAIHLMKLRGSPDSMRERDIIERQIRHMARLVDDLLDVSRLRRGAIELRRERFDLGEAIANAVEMTTPVYAEKGQQLDVDVPAGLDVDGDQTRIAQVFANLLSNAAKFTDAQGHVTVRARGDDGLAVIECRDDGIGMPAELVPRVFDLFVQGQDGLDRRQGGLGLGLAVAKTLVELHGGTIQAASDGVSRGSAFIVRLPLARTVAAAEALRGRRPGLDAPSRKIGLVMVVDDNRDALNMLIGALRHAGLDVVGAHTATGALELAAELHPTAAILDIGLPEMNGYDLARALRSLMNGSELRLVALTGYGRDQDASSARAAGFDAFFVKPAEISALVDALSGPLPS